MIGSTYAVIAAPVTTVPFGDPLKLGQRILWTGHYEAFGRPDSLRPVCPGFFPNPIQYTGYYSDGDIFEQRQCRRQLAMRCVGIRGHPPRA